MKITDWRTASWFATAALFLAIWMCLLGSAPHDALGGVIPSRGNESVGDRGEELRRIQRILETRIARQKLEDMGVPPDKALDKLREMSVEDLHVLASIADRIPEGGDENNIDDFVRAFWYIVIVVVVSLVVAGLVGLGFLAKYLHKKSRTKPASPPPEPAPEPPANAPAH